MTHRKLYLKAISKDEALSLLDEELINRVKRDSTPENHKPLSNQFANIGCFLNEKLVGFFSIRLTTASTIDVHINFVKKYRGYAKHFCLKMLKNLFSDENINRIESEIPVIYEEMVKFVQVIGFNVEGLKSGTFLKNGKWNDSYIVGITRKDYEH